jgi:NTP pyrophosphatase (non-canonical NTP hydrolase)
MTEQPASSQLRSDDSELRCDDSELRCDDSQLRSSDIWPSIDALWAWLDDGRPHGGEEGLLLRMLKLSEEVGEVAQAVIGATGQNPRKGVTHTWDDVQGELCDVVITALVALRTLTPDTREVFTRHLARVTARSLGPSDGN